MADTLADAIVVRNERLAAEGMDRMASALAALASYQCAAEGCTAGETDDPRGAGHALVAALLLWRQSAEVVGAACDVVGRLAAVSADNAAVLVRDAGVHTAVMAAMRAHTADVGVATRGCIALAWLATGTGVAAELVREGAAMAVMAAMRAHVMCPEVATAVCTAMMRMVAPDGPWLQVAAHAYCMAVSVLCNHAGNVSVVRSACAFLAFLLPVYPNGTPADAPDRLVTALREHTDDALLAQYACKAMHLLASKSGTTLLDRAGAPDVVTAALRLHVCNAEAARSAIAVLLDLAVMPASCDALMRAGAHGAVIAAMVAHIDDMALEATACSVMQVFTIASGNRVPLIRAWAHGALVACLRKCTGNWVGLPDACIALLGLARTPECRVPLLRAGVLDAMTAIATRCAGDARVAQPVLGTFWLLSDADGGPAELIRVGAHRVMVSSLTQPELVGYSWVAPYVWPTLARLAACDDYKAALRGVNAHHAAEAAMHNNDLEPMIAAHARDTLAKLTRTRT